MSSFFLVHIHSYLLVQTQSQDICHDLLPTKGITPVLTVVN